MNQRPDAASLRTSIPTVSAVLDTHASALGHDFVAYRNHVYRVVNLCLAIAGGGDRVALEKIAVAAVFHDLGIWTNHTFDYIAPSVALARQHLSASAHADWIPEIDAMIAEHHKITPSRPNRASLVEPFRRADWIDVSRGLRTFRRASFLRPFGVHEVAECGISLAPVGTDGRSVPEASTNPAADGKTLTRLSL